MLQKRFEVLVIAWSDLNTNHQITAISGDVWKAVLWLQDMQNRRHLHYTSLILITQKKPKLWVEHKKTVWYFFKWWSTKVALNCKGSHCTHKHVYTNNLVAQHEQQLFVAVCRFPLISLHISSENCSDLHLNFKHVWIAAINLRAVAIEYLWICRPFTCTIF